MKPRDPRSGPPPALSVFLELARAAGALLLLPWRVALFAVRRARLVAELSADLASARAPDEPPRPEGLGGRALSIFVSCAEPSGELHAVNLVRAIEAELAAAGAPAARWSGLGGPALDALGVRRIGDPVARAAMGFGVARALPYYLGLLTDVARHLRDERPDLVVLVDSPALHVPLGRIAKRSGRTVVHFVTPQYWGWAPWRVRSYSRAIDLALSILPFEPAWFARHGVRAAHVGHPLLDELADVPSTRPRPDSRTLVVLPGSRASVVERNLPWMLSTVARLRERRPDVEVVFPHARAEVRATIARHLADAGATAWARVGERPLHEELRDARAALSVSGTVLLDLLHHRLPTVVVYRVSSALQSRGANRILTVPWFASLNLLAGEEVAREFCFHGDGPAAEVLDSLLEVWDEGPARERRIAGLDRAAERLGPPGACRRAARFALAEAAARRRAD